MDIEIEEDALNFLADICDGDARIALNALELAVLTSLSEVTVNFILIYN